MKKQKKYQKLLLVVCILFVGLSGLSRLQGVSAATLKCPGDLVPMNNTDCVPCPPGQKDVQNNDKCQLDNPAPDQLVGEDDFGDLIKNFIEILLYFAGSIAVVFLIIGGFQYVMSRGSEEGMEKAKKTIQSAVIGIVLIVMAFAIVTIINTLLTKGPGEQAPAPASSDSPNSSSRSNQQQNQNSRSSLTDAGLFQSYAAGDDIVIKFTVQPSDNYTWFATGNPEWLHIYPDGNSASLIGQVPSGASPEYSITVTASRDADQASKSFKIVIRQPGQSRS